MKKILPLVLFLGIGMIHNITVARGGRRHRGGHRRGGHHHHRRHHGQRGHRRYHGTVMNPFLQSVRTGNTVEVENYLNGGGEINVRSAGHNRTGLMIASAENNVEMVRLLVQRGADLNLQGGLDDNTALSMAAKRGNSDVVAILIEAGADTNIKNKYDDTVHELAEYNLNRARAIVEMLESE